MTAQASPETAQGAEVIDFIDAVEVEAGTVHRWLRDGDALLIDVREANEFENERIPGALLMPLSFLDVGTFPRIRGQKVVLLCSAGKRSAAAAKQLWQAGHPRPFNLQGGLGAWKEAGFATEE